MISRRSVLSQIGLVAAAGAGAWWLRDRVFWPAPEIGFTGGATGSGWLPFTAAGQGSPIVEGRLNGAPIEVLVDSGAQSSVIDRGLAQRLGLPTALVGPVIVAVGVSGTAQLGRAATFDLRLGDLALGSLRAATLNLASISGASGRGFALILGQDVLRHLVGDFDFAAARLAFHDPQAWTPPSGAVAAQVRLKGRELLVPVTIEGAFQFEAAVDTGSSAALALSTETAQAARLFGRPVRWVPSITFGGVGRDRVVEVSGFSFAGRDYGRTAVHVYEPAGDKVPDGLVGVEAMRDMRVFLDAGRGRLLHLPAAD